MIREWKFRYTGELSSLCSIQPGTAESLDEYSNARWGHYHLISLELV